MVVSTKIEQPLPPLPFSLVYVATSLGRGHCNLLGRQEDRTRFHSGWMQTEFQGDESYHNQSESFRWPRQKLLKCLPALFSIIANISQDLLKWHAK